MSNEIHIGIIEERKQLYPDRGDRSPDLVKWLDYKKHLIKALPVGIDSIAKDQARLLSRVLNTWPEIVNLANRNQVTYKMLKEVLRNLRSDGNQDDRTIVNSLPDSVISWILDVATGRCEEPKSVGRSRNTYLMRDLQIVQMVEGVHDAMMLPYESDERYSACHEVAVYLDMKYGKVRTIWRKKRDKERSTDD